MKCMSYLILYSISQLSGVQPAEVHGETWHQSRHCGIPTGMVCCARVCYGVLCACGMGAVWWGGGGELLLWNPEHHSAFVRVLVHL